MKRRLLAACGLAATGLGAAGLFLPLLPATPFLLLALYCFARSSERLHRWLLGNRLCGAHLRAYVAYRAVTPATKVCSITILWASLAASALLLDTLIIRILLLAVGIGVSIHLLLLRTVPREGLDPGGSIQAAERA
ncbi:MAG: YbaN family protein [Candidatus Edwardsbacteria bacterium]|jgi:hypothetical protein|nr:YbaN family protein [Candidatus Edwardsbacteria bacterium]